VTQFATIEAAGLMPAPVRERKYVQPGQIHVSAKPTAITTILGSCVAVCLWDEQRQIGGLNHFMLPFTVGTAMASPRFGNVAMEMLLNEMKAAGGRQPLLRARVFGGSCMFEAMRSSAHLGQKNVDLAMEILTRLRIEVVQVDVGGNRGRKIIFNTDEGSACLISI
jgi:chemotaxis protein CheD